MITVTAPLWVWKGEGAGQWHFLTVPEEQSGAIRAHAFGSPRGFGSVRVEATVGGVTWRTSVFPASDGGYLLPIKAAVRKQAGLVVGEDVTVRLDLL